MSFSQIQQRLGGIYALEGVMSLERPVVGDPRPEPSTEQNEQPGENLADCFAEIVLDIGPRLRVADCEPQPVDLPLRQLPPQPPGAKSNHRDHTGDHPGPLDEHQRPQGQRSGIYPYAGGKGGENDQHRGESDHQLAKRHVPHRGQHQCQTAIIIGASAATTGCRSARHCAAATLTFPALFLYTRNKAALVCHHGAASNRQRD